MTFAPDNSQGFFLDPILILPDDETDAMYRAKDLYEQIADSVNIRDIAIYPLVEVETGQQWFVPGNPQRYYDGWRKVIQLPNLSAGGTTGAIATGIVGLLKYTHVWAQGTDGTNFYEIPFADDAGTGNISLRTTATTVTVTGGATSPALTGLFVVLEYIKGD